MIPTNIQILTALEVLEKYVKHMHPVDAEQTDSIDKKYNGYCAAFSGGVVRMGLLQVVMLYHNDTNRILINQIVFEIYKKFNKEIEKEDLFEFLKENKNYKKSVVKKEIIQIATALKMAIRTYILI